MNERTRAAPARRVRPAPARASLLALAALAAGCATPLRPSGGPEDRTPPAIVTSVPAAGSVRVTSPRVALTFTERVDEAALRRALVVSPAPDTPPDIRVRGREVEIVIADSLRRDVTYVLSIGTELRDLRGVALAAPLVIAFATGDRIDTGRISGSVRHASSGRPAGGLAVLAYRLPSDSARVDPGATPADYRTQAGTDGSYAFSHLRAGRYFVAALDDRNRDGLAGSGERFAAPPRPAVVASDSGDAAVIAMFLTTGDTTGPVLRGARAGTALVARFDEPVVVAPGAAAAFSLTDSTTGRPVEIGGAWAFPGDRREVLLETSRLTPSPHILRIAADPAVADSSGNPAPASSVSFTPRPAPADTTAIRLANFLPQGPVEADSAMTLLPGERAGARFSLPIDTVRARGRIAVRNPAGAPLPFRITREDASSVRLDVPATEFVVTVGDASRRFSVASSEDLGGIVGTVTTAGATAVVEAVPEAGTRGDRRAIGAGVDGGFQLSGLAPGSYRVRVWLDADADGAWDAGALIPYAAPEPLGWLTAPVRVRARWDTDLGSVSITDGVAVAEGLADTEIQE